MYDELSVARWDMYGLIFENLRQYIIAVYGEDKWEEIRRQARVEHPSFTTHDIYPDSVILRIVGKGCKVQDKPRLQQAAFGRHCIQAVNPRLMY